MVLLGKLSKCAIIFTIAVTIATALASFIPSAVYAQNPVDLDLGGTGATPWNISNIKPGDSGTQAIQLHNAGDRAGRVTIWISDITVYNHGGDGRALGNYMLFSLNGAALTTNIALPARIDDFPQSATSANYLRIDHLDAGETVNLVWEWVFEETGQPQNHAQGDGLSFTINYLLEEILPSSDVDKVEEDTPIFHYIQLNVPGRTTMARVSPLGVLLYTYEVASPDGSIILKFDAGTQVTCESGDLLRKIVLKASQESPTAPEGIEIIGRTYEIVGYAYSPYAYTVSFSRPVKLTLSYDTSRLPEDTASVNIGSYDAMDGWIVLESPPDSVPYAGKSSALITRSSIFTVLATPEAPSSPSIEPAVETPRPPPDLPDIPGGLTPEPSASAPLEPSETPGNPLLPVPLPAEFELLGLKIDPLIVETGEPVAISVFLQNTGGLEGSYTLNLEIDRQVQQSREITLAAGESVQVDFHLVEDRPGTYTVTLGSLSGELTIQAPKAPTFRSNTFLWAVSLVIPTAGLLIYLLTIKFKIYL
jgi:hypothetical protein